MIQARLRTTEYLTTSVGSADSDTRRHTIATPTPTYTVQAVEPDRRHMTGSASYLNQALAVAWSLNRHIEGDVEVIENASYDEDKDDYSGPPRRVALVSVRFFD